MVCQFYLSFQKTSFWFCWFLLWSLLFLLHSNGNVFLIYTFRSVTMHDGYLRYCFNWCSYFYLPILWLTYWTVHVNMKSFPAWSLVLWHKTLLFTHYVQLFTKLWISACKPCLSFTISWSFLKFMSISWWCHPTISASVAPFSSCLQSFPAPESFPMSQFFASGGQSIGASASVLLMNIQGWFPLGLTHLISLLSNGLSKFLSSTTIWKHQFFTAQPSLWSSSHIHPWLLEKP